MKRINTAINRAASAIYKIEKRQDAYNLLNDLTFAVMNNARIDGILRAI
jgi:hypothetical protein